jgi:hypothetical protein
LLTSPRALKPAALSSSTRSAAWKSPVTSKVVTPGSAVSPVTPSTVAIAPLMARQHGPQQLWMPDTVTRLTFPLGTSPTGFIARFSLVERP